MQKFRLDFENELRKGITSKGYARQRYDRCGYDSKPKSTNNDEYKNIYDTFDSTNELVPMVTIVIQGDGPKTLRVIEEKLNVGVPVLILAVIPIFFIKKFCRQKMSSFFFMIGNKRMC
jgi:hypothetical protein